MIRRQIKKEDQINQTYQSWNSFVDLLALETYDDLTEIQRRAQLVFWYDAEVNNGGHLQYFLNSAGKRSFETLDVLSELGLWSQHSILQEAIENLQENPLPSIETAEEYVVEALEGKFDKLDQRYYACQNEIDSFLEKYLEENFDEFIELT